MARFSIRNWFGLKNKLAGASRPRRHTRLRLEVLEDRLAPATLQVGGNNPQYLTIQAAVNAAQSGDQIQVNAGTYIGQVVIPASLSNVKIQGQGNPMDNNIQNVTIVEAPSTLTGNDSIIDVNGAQNIQIQNLRIQGAAANLSAGIRVDDGGSAVIQQNYIPFINDGTYTSSTNTFGSGNVDIGVGILVGRDNGTDVTTGTATIQQNTVSGYQGAGIVIDNAGSSGAVEHNTVIGAGPTNIQQTGILVSNGAAADVDHNAVSGNIFTDPFGTGNEAGGILVFYAASGTSHPDGDGDDASPNNDDVTYGVVVEQNTVTNNQDGIFVFNSNLEKVDHNTTNNNTADGIQVAYSNQTDVDHNKAQNNGRDGVDLFFANNSVVSQNQTQGNVEAGYRLEGNNNSFDHNQSQSDLGDGFLLVNASNNVFTQNQAKQDGMDGFLLTCDSSLGVTSGSNSNSFSQDQAQQNGFNGYELQDSNLNTFSQEQSQQNGSQAGSNSMLGNGFVLENCAGNTFTNNSQAQGNEFDGFALYGSSSNTIQNCQAQNNERYGISLNDVSMNDLLSNNQTNGNEVAGVYIDSSSSTGTGAAGVTAAQAIVFDTDIGATDVTGVTA